MHLLAREQVSHVFRSLHRRLISSRRADPRQPRPFRRTFCIHPVRIAIGQSGAVAELLDRLRRFVVDLEERTGPPPTGLVLLFRHFVHTSPTRRIRARVVGDGTLEEEWRRQFAGFVWDRGKRIVGAQPG